MLILVALLWLLFCLDVVFADEKVEEELNEDEDEDEVEDAEEFGDK